MPRTQAELRDIAFRITRHVNDAHPGLGMVGVILDVGVRKGQDQPINILLHGLREDEALALLRRCVEIIEKVDKQEKNRILTLDSQLIVPGFTDLNKLKGN